MQLSKFLENQLNAKEKKKMKRETKTALCLQINAGNFLMPPYSLPRLTQTMSVVHDGRDVNISWCASENQQGWTVFVRSGLWLKQE